MTTVMTIDPGLNGTGLAIWDSSSFQKCKTPPYPIKTLVIKKNGSDWRQKVYFYSLNILRLAETYKTDRVYIEDPQYFDSGKGQMVARKQDLKKLVYLVGYMDCMLSGSEIEVNLVSIMKWKGQMPKDVIHRRVLKYLPDLQVRSHDVDAVGIGLYILGVM